MHKCRADSRHETLHEKCLYGFFSRPYFPLFSPNTGKYGPEKTPYLDTFHAKEGIYWRDSQVVLGYLKMT